jgi:hypothetical protein
MTKNTQTDLSHPIAVSIGADLRDQRAPRAPRRTVRQRCRQVAVEPAHPAAPAPIWLAALIATRCQAIGAGADDAIVWKWVAGWALYTNTGVGPKFIQPLGVRLQGGETLAVTWGPGETAYKVEVYPRLVACA